MGVPIVNFGFSEEYKENVFGITDKEGVEITSDGLVEYARELGDLGLAEWLEAHGDLVNAFEEAWENITDIVNLEDVGDFIREHNVYDRLTEPWLDPGNWIGAGNLMGAGLAISLNEIIVGVDIFLNEFFPYLEEKVDQMETDVERRLEAALDKLGTSDGEGGSSMGESDDYERCAEEAEDDFLDELDPDQLEPDDVGDLSDAFGDLAGELAEFENDLDETDFSDVPEAEEFSQRLLELKKQLFQHNGSLNELTGRMDGFLHRKYRYQDVLDRGSA
jgi:hypothetical protein